MTYVTGNSGRRYGTEPVVTADGPRVRCPVQSPQGAPLRREGDTLTPDAARARGLALIEAAATAEAMAAMGAPTAAQVRSAVVQMSGRIR